MNSEVLIFGPILNGPAKLCDIIAGLGIVGIDDRSLAKDAIAKGRVRLNGYTLTDFGHEVISCDVGKSGLHLHVDGKAYLIRWDGRK